MAIEAFQVGGCFGYVYFESLDCSFRLGLEFLVDDDLRFVLFESGHFVVELDDGRCLIFDDTELMQNAV